jgi:Ca2+-binding RTX toxin-like protein
VDAFDGGADSDTIDFSQEFGTLGVNVRLKNGDVLDTYGNAEKAVGIENLIGTDRRDILNGDNEDNVIEGGGDRDTIGGLDGDDVLKGGAKKDNIGGGKGNDEIEGGGGNDTIFGGADRDLIKGGGGKDTIFGEAGADTIDGGGGKDQIKDDKMEVEPAVLMDDIRDEWDNDGRFSGVFDARANVLVGGAGNDSIFGIGVLDGGRGNDELTGFGFMNGGAGNDTLIEDASLSGAPVSNRRSPDTIMSGGDGNDRMVGGDLDYSYAQSGVCVNMNNGTAIVSARDKDTFEDVNGLFLTEFADMVKTGLSENQFFELGGGNDTVDANVTLDRLDGRVFINAEDGDDVIRSTGDSEIVVRGGQGSDTVEVKGTEQKVAVLGGAQNDTITVDTKGAVDITGDAGKDTITVSAGIGPKVTERSLISGGGQNDTITLSNVNNARANGGTGKDTFIIEFVSQVNLNGGNRADVFIIRSGDVLIEDFGRGKDVLDLRQAKGLTSTTFTELLGSSVDGFDGLDISVGSYTVTLDGLTKADLTSDMVLI